MFKAVNYFCKKASSWMVETVLITPCLFHDGVRYHIETSPLICFANQWTGFYMITASVMKELKPFDVCGSRGYASVKAFLWPKLIPRSTAVLLTL